MKKTKKLLTLALCLLLLFATLAVAHAVEARTIAEPCPYCGEDVRTSIDYEDMHTFTYRACKHGKSGSDVYRYYEKIEIHTCGSMDCSYKETVHTGETVLRYEGCIGYDD